MGLPKAAACNRGDRSVSKERVTASTNCTRHDRSSTRHNQTSKFFSKESRLMLTATHQFFFLFANPATPSQKDSRSFIIEFSCRRLLGPLGSTRDGKFGKDKGFPCESSLQTAPFWAWPNPSDPSKPYFLFRMKFAISESACARNHQILHFQDGLCFLVVSEKSCPLTRPFAPSFRCQRLAFPSDRGLYRTPGA
jgi:hypothetical protein